MINKIWRLSKASPTFLAWVWLLSSVCTDVTLQMTTNLGRVRTVWALMELVTRNFFYCCRMYSAHMLKKIWRLSKALPTFCARVWLLSSVSTDVSPQRTTAIGIVRTMWALFVLVKHEMSNFFISCGMYSITVEKIPHVKVKFHQCPTVLTLPSLVVVIYSVTSVLTLERSHTLVKNVGRAFLCLQLSIDTSVVIFLQTNTRSLTGKKPYSCRNVGGASPGLQVSAIIMYTQFYIIIISSTVHSDLCIW